MEEIEQRKQQILGDRANNKFKPEETSEVNNCIKIFSISIQNIVINRTKVNHVIMFNYRLVSDRDFKADIIVFPDTAFWETLAISFNINPLCLRRIFRDNNTSEVFISDRDPIDSSGFFLFKELTI